MYKFFLTLLIAALSTVSVARAEGPHPWTLSLGAGAMLIEGDKESYDSQAETARVGYDLNNRWTLEAGILGVPSQEERESNGEHFFVKGDNWLIGGTLEALYHVKADRDKWDPFVAAGGGFLHSKRNLPDGRNDAFGDVGAGVGYSINDFWGVRADYRFMLVGEDTQIDQTILLSLTYRPGGSNVGLGEEGEGPLQTIYFGFDSSALTDEAKAKLRANADWLSKNSYGKVILQGHCDERGTQEYNYALGERRAKAALDYLNSLGVSKERLETISFGEDRPADQGHNNAAWTKNRRVVCALD